MGQKTSFSDKDGKSVDQLNARLQSNIKSPMELLELNLIVLALMALCMTVQFNMFAGSYRVRYELQFNAMNETVFRESSKTGAESISAFMTVTALVMAENIRCRYES
ncbi:hypothetical protein B0T13DRAFT_511637 [Neurospora crassa]|nr:hypothetical protein B0T13DRAFT_511637 [Neurospora crassa]